MTFGAPLGLLLLLAAPVLVAMYLLRRKGPPRVVSAVFLWKTPERTTQAGPRLELLRAETSLMLELLAIVAGALFLADANCGPSPGERTVVVVDGSFSMRASPTLAAAREAARELVDDAAAVTLIESGRSPRVLAGPEASSEEAQRALESWSPSQGSHSIDVAIALAEELGGRESGLTLVTDAPLPDGANRDGVRIIAVGSPLPNLAFIEVLRTDEAGRATVRVQVANYGVEPARTEVVLADGVSGEQRARKPITLSPGAVQPVELVATTPGVLRLFLPEDALTEDGVLELLPEPERPVRVSGAFGPDTAAARSLSRFLAAADGVSTEAPPDLIFSDRESDTGAWQVLVSTDGDRTTTTAGPFFLDRRHPLLQDVSMEGVVWTSGTGAEGTPLVSARERSLLTEVREGVFRFDIDLARSNLERTPAWPVLLANLIELRRASLPGFLRHNVVAGIGLTVTCPKTGRCELEGPGGTATLTPGTHRIEDAVPGRHVLLVDGKELDVASVALVDAAESDLRARGTSTQGTLVEASSAHKMSRPSWALVVLLVAVLLDLLVAAPGLRRGGAR